MDASRGNATWAVTASRVPGPDQRRPGGPASDGRRAGGRAPAGRTSAGSAGERASERRTSGRAGERASGRAGERASGRAGERASGRAGERASERRPGGRARPCDTWPTIPPRYHGPGRPRASAMTGRDVRPPGHDGSGCPNFLINTTSLSFRLFDHLIWGFCPRQTREESETRSRDVGDDHGLGRLDGWGAWMILPEVTHETGGTDVAACAAPNSRRPVVDVPEGNL
jgi:hypothetical protein